MIKYYMKLIYLLAFTLLLMSNYSRAVTYTIDSVPNPYKQANITYVVNPDQIITKEDVATIYEQLAKLESESTVEVTVVALNSIGNVDTRQFANQLFNKWKIGRSKLNNGLLILLVVDQRQVVFETGYGLEGILPDITCYKIQQQYMVPLLQKNNFSKGLVEGVNGTYRYLISHGINKEFTKMSNKSSGNKQISWNNFLISSFFVALSAILLIIILPRRGNKEPQNILRKADIWAFIISIFIFIFVPSFLLFLLFYLLFYRNFLVKKTIFCPNCHSSKYIILSGIEAKTYLSEKKWFEKKIGAAKNEVYRCLNCNHIYTIAWPTNRYAICSNCKVNALEFDKPIIIKQATSRYAGEGVKKAHCLYCGYRFEHPFSIPMITQPNFDHYDRYNDHDSNSRGGGSSGGGGSRSSF